MNNDKEKWMKYALREAEKALKVDEVPIGAIIIRNNVIIGRGYNQVESLNDPTAHAEIIAITSASNTTGDWRLNDCSIYVTKEPCLMCFGSILNSRISNLYFGLRDEEKGFSNSVYTSKRLEKHLKYSEGGILEFDSKEMLQNFFLKKRNSNKL